MKRLLATGLLLLLASVPLFAQEKVAIVPPPSADTSAAADAESTSATPGEKTALPSAQEITIIGKTRCDEVQNQMRLLEG